MNFTEIHKNRRKPLAVKRTDTVTIDGSWRICNNIACPVPAWAIDDYTDYFVTSFNITLSGNGDNIFVFEIDEDLGNGFEIIASEHCVKLVGGTVNACIQAMLYSEDIMNGLGAPCLEKKTYHLTPRFFPRIVSSALEDGAYTDEYLKIILHYGINGVILRGGDYEAQAAKAKKYGLLTYLVTDSIRAYADIDGIIIEAEPTEEITALAQKSTVPCIFSTIYWTKQYELPADLIVLKSFEDGVVLERDGVKKKLRHTSLANAVASDSLNASENTLWVSCSTLGRTADFPTVPYLPAFLQFFLRNDSLFSLPIQATVEAYEFGFVPSIVGEFQKSQSYMECEQAGIALQRLIVGYYGAENTDKLMLVFKKISDGVNYVLPDKADMCGPLMFGPGYPLLTASAYDYDFEHSDITLETDCILKGAECFFKAAAILSHIDNVNARELYRICLFASNTLETCANSKRWYRRLFALKTEKLDFKRSFIIEQMKKIGEEEIKNAKETADIIFEIPELAHTSYEELCTIGMLEAKIKLTEEAMKKLG